MASKEGENESAGSFFKALFWTLFLKTLLIGLVLHGVAILGATILYFIYQDNSFGFYVEQLMQTGYILIASFALTLVSTISFEFKKQ